MPDDKRVSLFMVFLFFAAPDQSSFCGLCELGNEFLSDPKGGNTAGSEIGGTDCRIADQAMAHGAKMSLHWLLQLLET